jgi:organic radical activating enzyme
MTKEEKLNKGISLPLMEEFYSIQGEGYHSGKAAYFIRIGGCDVGCHWCDVKESWDADIHPVTDADQIVSKVLKYAETVVITGGEPLESNLNYLTDELKKQHIKIHLETSGSHEMTGDFDWICLSPKKNKPPLKAIYKKADELKIIIRTKKDLEFAEEQAKLVRSDCELYLQPEWSVRELIIPVLTDYVMAHPNWKISIQMHKYLNIP